MSSEVQSLVILVKSDAVKEGGKNLDGLTKSAGAAEKATDALKDAFREIIGPLLGIAGAIKGFEKLVDVTKEFQSLEASLKTATGSAAAATVAFDALRELAASTPFELKDLTEAFVGLVNKGLDPSTAALKAYGNIAVATNQSLTGVVDAVGRAALGQYRGLLELGIKAVEVEDGIVLSFHGTSTKIAKDSKEIQQYIQNLGTTQFAGAMETQEKTLTGAIHELKNAWDELFFSISEKGSGELIAKGVRIATQAIEELTAMVASGQLGAYVKAIGLNFQGWGDDVSITLKFIENLFRTTMDAVGIDATKTGGVVSEAFSHFGPNLRGTMAGIGAFVSLAFLMIENVATHAWDVTKAVFDLVTTSATATGEILAAKLNPFAKDADIKIAEGYGKIVQATDTYRDSLGRIRHDFDLTATAQVKSTEEVITAAMDQRDSAVKAIDVQIDAGARLREEWDKERASRKAFADFMGTDALATFKPPPGNTHIQTAEEVAAFQSLKKSLQLEEDTIEQSYKRRLELIKNNTIAGSQEQIELTKELDNRVTLEYEKAAQDRFDKVKTLDDELNQAIADGDYSRVDNLMFTLSLEEDEIKKSYARRKSQIMADEKLTAQQKLELTTKLENEYTQRQKELELRRTSQVLTASSQLFQSLADIAADAAGKQSTLYKVMFAASKAFAIADSLVKIQQGIANAFVLPWPANLAAAASVAAATAGIIANISSVAGVFDTGGMIPAGKFGIAGEKGAELIQGPAVVTSTRSTADRWGQGGGSPNVTINIENHTDAQATVQEKDGDNGKVIEVIIKRVESSLSGGVRGGGTPFSRSLERTYGLKRGAV